mgnify:CR=1 FL=1
MASGDWANRLGTYVAYGTGGERYGAYVPPPLPPDPPLQLGRLSIREPALIFTADNRLLSMQIPEID